MKGKPDLSAAAADQFLRGGQAAVAEATPAAPERITKTIRMDRSLDQALKRAALERSVAAGARVTESDLIDLAIKQYLKL
jgi:hypothetical protein